MEEVESCPFEEDHPDYVQSRSVLEEYFIREHADETDDSVRKLFMCNYRM